ncbi:uncharacterized protein LOC128293803 [Gossypium arboreum]|uniref:uncharacterized protein LOC128293803 n=1 Tax=Gossypium arboreum TaxID=29729 RepID=UPI0022F150AF|nr:uncharacterized protein LOC128293803 [Gossypium arboreum]
MLPINYESWHNMPNSNKNQALSNIKDRFALEVSDAYIKKALGKKWRDNKSILKKKYFKKPISLEEKLQNVPPGMLRYQWEDAVRFWNSKKGEDRERVGTSSRQKQKFTHTAGSKSFACVAQAEEASSGQKVRRLQLLTLRMRKKMELRCHPKFEIMVLARNLVVTRAGVDSRVDFGGKVTVLMASIGELDRRSLNLPDLLRREGKELGLKTLADNFRFLGLCCLGLV